MTVRTTVAVPQQLYKVLRRKAEQSGVSIQALIIHAIEQAYKECGKGDYVTGPMVKSKGMLGPAFPKDENPHDLVF